MSMGEQARTKGDGASPQDILTASKREGLFLVIYNEVNCLWPSRPAYQNWVGLICYEMDGVIKKAV